MCFFLSCVQENERAVTVQRFTGGIYEQADVTNTDHKQSGTHALMSCGFLKAKKPSHTYNTCLIKVTPHLEDF